MPPTLLLQQNPVERIAAKLTQGISSTIVGKTWEQVRILETRVRTGTLGKSDCSETRTAVVLEMVYRQETSTRLPWKDLAAAVGVKPRSLEQFQQIIRNYLTTTTAATSTASRLRHGSNNIPSTTSRGTNLLSSLSRKRPLASTTATVAAATTTKLSARPTRTTRMDNIHHSSSTNRRLAELTIRLAVHLQDPHGACRAAQQLMQDMLVAVENHPSVHERRGLRYEFQRYQAAYEAAALYCVSRQQLQQQQQQYQQQDKSNPADEQEQPLKPLDLHDLSEASTEFSYLELKQVLPHMLKTVEALKSKKQVPPEQTRGELSRKPAAAAARTTKESSSAATQNETISLDEIEYTNNDDSEIGQEEEEDATFQQWQESVLSEACQQARKSLDSMTEEKDRIDEDSSVLPSHHDPVLLAKAADDILIKYGILSSCD